MKSEAGELVFVVRLWLQGGGSGTGEWRGAIHEVRSGKRFYVTGTRDIAEFIDAAIAQRSKPGVH